MRKEIEFKEQFGKTLSEIRKENNVTQQQLADKINYSDKSISKWERGESLPDLYTTYTICEKLGTTPNDLFGIENITDLKESVSYKNDIIEKKKKLVSIFVPMITAFGILLICCILYFILKSIPDKAFIAPSSFCIIVPVMFTVLLVLSFIIWKRKAQFICLTGLIWSLGWSLYVMIKNLSSATNVELYIIISCVLLQIIAALVFVFIHMMKEIEAKDGGSNI